MESITVDKATNILYKKKVSLFGINDAKKVFAISKDNTVYKLLQRLEKKNIIKRIENGKYLFSFTEVSDFEIANFLFSPSYISLESALSFYGILSQFPYTITSVTSKKSKRVVYEDKEYEFVHIESKYFYGFLKKDRFLIASPEKALIDMLYFMAKKLRSIPMEELDLSKINKKYLLNMAKKYDYIPLKKLVDRIC
jgi:predicted transcriptional regulator of viral defense system